MYGWRLRTRFRSRFLRGASFYLVALADCGPVFLPKLFFLLPCGALVFCLGRLVITRSVCKRLVRLYLTAIRFVCSVLFSWRFFVSV